MSWIKIKTITKKMWLTAKKFWWALVLVLGLVVAFLIYCLTKNSAYIASLMDLMEIKRDAYDQEMDTLARIHETEIAEKNEKMKEHQKRMRELEKEYAKKGKTLDKEKEATLKRLVDESYNDPEKLSREIAKAFGLEHG